MDDDTGLADSTSKQQAPRQKVDVYREVLRRLHELNCEDANAPSFDGDLLHHFDRLPDSYAFYVNVERPEYVLAHKRLLTLAEDPANGPVFEISPILRSNLIHWNHAQSLAKSVKHRPMHEITFSAVDRPKLLAETTLLLLDLSLNIQEARAFSTTDGYSLDAFLVDGWSKEGTEELQSAIESQITKIKNSSSVSRFEKDFQAIQKLGRGGFGVVHLARHRMDEHNYAVKMMKLTGLSACSRRMAIREAKMMASLDHLNIVTYQQVWLDSNLDEYFKFTNEEKEKDGLGESKKEVGEDISLDDEEKEDIRLDDQGEDENEKAELGKLIVELKEDAKEVGEDIRLDDEEKEDTRLDDQEEDENEKAEWRKLIAELKEDAKEVGEDISLDDEEKEEDIRLDDQEDDENEKAEWRKLIAELKEEGITFAEPKEEGEYGSHIAELKEDENDEASFICIQMDYYPSTLEEVLEAKKYMFEEELAAKLFRQMVESLDYLHGLRIVHRDLNPKNVFVDRNMNIKLGDFGLAKSLDVAENETKNSVEIEYLEMASSVYRAPEQGENALEKADMYSLGVMLYELYRPFTSSDQRKAELDNLTKKGQVDSVWAKKFSTQLALVMTLISSDPEERPSARRVLEELIVSHLQG